MLGLVHFNVIIFSTGYDSVFQPKINAPTLRTDPGAFSDGTAVFWRRSRVRARGAPTALRFNGAPEGWPWTQVAVVVPLEIAGGIPFVVAATHLKAGAGAVNDATREQQVRQLAAFLEQSRRSAPPRSRSWENVLLLGDLNTVHSSRACAALEKESPMGFASAYSAGGRPPPSFTTWKASLSMYSASISNRTPCFVGRKPLLYL